MALADLIAENIAAFSPPLDPALTDDNTIPMDLTGSSRQADDGEADRVILARIAAAGAIAGVGGYLERRSVYRDTALFRGDSTRCIHVGVDVFMPAGTPVYTPLAGRLHSFANRQVEGDYGPVIILQHRLAGVIFHSLYGHLAEESLADLRDGMEIPAGRRLASIGGRGINGNWPPHLHFQLIEDMQGQVGDYPGVVRPDEVEFYRRNCPDPHAVLVASGKNSGQ